MNEFANKLVSNLKALNAKERDHLMRWAYLGKAGEYGESTIWLSTDMEDELRDCLDMKSIKEEPSTKVVFAGMDYHLNWVFAALKFACGENPELISDSLTNGKKWRMDGLENFPHMPVDADDDARSLWPIRGGNGSHEDIDLLVVFMSGDGKTTMAFVEAKGTTAFNEQKNVEQLARKLIRLDLILSRAIPESRRDLVAFRLILTAPGDDPGFIDIFNDVNSQQVRNTDIPRKGQRENLRKNLCKELDEWLQKVPGQDALSSGIDKNVRWLSLNTPPNLLMVKRCRETSDKSNYQFWRIKKRLNSCDGERPASEGARSKQSFGNVSCDMD